MGAIAALLFMSFVVTSRSRSLIVRCWPCGTPLQRLIEWYFYMRIQRNYPKPGSICLFGRKQLECMVISNHYGNNAVVLHVQDAAWDGGAYIILTYCWICRLWPSLTMGIIDNPKQARITRGYFLDRHELATTTVCSSIHWLQCGNRNGFCTRTWRSLTGSSRGHVCTVVHVASRISGERV